MKWDRFNSFLMCFTGTLLGYSAYTGSESSVGSWKVLWAIILLGFAGATHLFFFIIERKNKEN